MIRSVNLDDRYEVVVVGGGTTGLSIIYHLAKAGIQRVLLLERGYLGGGASGRNTGGVRAQFETAEEIELAYRSLRKFERLSSELNFNVWFRQGGYLHLCRYEDQVARAERAIRLQRSLGVKSRWLTPSQINRLVPVLNLDGILGAAYHARDGIAVHQGVIWGYWRAAIGRGATVRDFQCVAGLELEGGAIRGVKLSNGRVIQSNCVIVCAGPHSRELIAPLGIDLPVMPFRRQIMVTEPLRPFLKPFLRSSYTSAGTGRDPSIVQTVRGELVVQFHDPHEPSSYRLNSSFGFLENAASGVVRLIPPLRYIRILRQWTGWYDTTPDEKPILGKLPGISNLLIACGFSGHGFMLAPIVGESISRLYLGRQPSVPLKGFSFDRFLGAHGPQNPRVG